MMSPAAEPGCKQRPPDSKAYTLFSTFLRPLATEGRKAREEGAEEGNDPGSYLHPGVLT